MNVVGQIIGILEVEPENRKVGRGVLTVFLRRLKSHMPYIPNTIASRITAR